MTPDRLLAGMVALGVLVLASAGVLGWRAWALATDGERVTATVERAAHIRNGGTLVELSFTAQGRAVRTEAQWPSRLRTPKEGSTVEVRVRPDAPEQVAPADEGPDVVGPVALAVLGLAFVIVPVALRRRGPGA